jgi:hypothetical protein
MLHDDNTESAVESVEDIEEYDGRFGFEHSFRDTEYIAEIREFLATPEISTPTGREEAETPSNALSTYNPGDIVYLDNREFSIERMYEDSFGHERVDILPTTGYPVTGIFHVADLNRQLREDSRNFKYFPDLADKPLDVDSLEVGDIIGYEGKQWEINTIQGDTYISFDNLDKSDFEAGQSRIGNWKERFIKDGVILVSKAPLKFRTDSPNPRKAEKPKRVQEQNPNQESLFDMPETPQEVSATSGLSVSETAENTSTPSGRGSDDNVTNPVSHAQSDIPRNSTEHILWNKFNSLFKGMNDTYDYMRLEASEGLMPLSIERVGSNRYALMHFYTQNGDLMRDPDMEFIVDNDKQTITFVEFQQDGYPQIYQRVEDENGGGASITNGKETYNPQLSRELNRFARNWFNNIENQEYLPVRATLRETGEEILFDNAPATGGREESRQGTNYRLPDSRDRWEGDKTRYADNVAAIRTLKLIESEDREATSEEKDILSRYVGWGGLANAFNGADSSWIKEYRELSELLTPEEYKAAQKSTLNAHYTSTTVIDSIYSALEKMGLPNGSRILEPSCKQRTEARIQNTDLR